MDANPPVFIDVLDSSSSLAEVAASVARGYRRMAPHRRSLAMGSRWFASTAL
jgi:hypothetical protein